MYCSKCGTSSGPITVLEYSEELGYFAACGKCRTLLTNEVPPKQEEVKISFSQKVVSIISKLLKKIKELV